MYGKFHKHLELFEFFKAFREDPDKALEMYGGDEDLSYALQEGSGSPEGNVDFPIFLQTVIRHKLRERFRTVAAVWDSYVGIESAQDFRETTVSSLGAIRGIQPIPEYGEYPRMRSSEEGGPSFAVGKYGGIYSVTFELIINDEVGKILSRIPGELGRSMAEYVNQAVVAFIESNPTYIDGKAFFHADHGNEITGEAATPNEDNLAALLDLLKLRRDAENMPIVIEPRRLLVRNPSTKMLFDKIIRSQTTGVQSEITAAGAPTFAPGTYNPLQNALPADATIEDPWLNDPNDYYLLADADDRPPFVAAFLRDQRDPAIFLKDDGMRGVGGNGRDPYLMNVDEIPFKIRHVFGVGMGEPQAAIRARP